MAENSKCLVCGGDTFSTLFTCTDSLTTGESFSICQCSGCGFRFTLSPPPESVIGKYYLSDEYISHSDLKRSFTERLYHVARTFMLRKKLRLIRSVSSLKQGSILDIGCGTGYFPAFMKQNGWDASGVEVSEIARNYAASKFELKVIPPDQTPLLQGKSYDCITLWHVMEHFHDPDAWFKKIDYLLKDNGICIIALPNAESYDAAWFKQHWAAFDVPRHLWHFSPATFKKLALRNNFSMIKTMSMPLDVFYISILSYRNMNSSMSLLRGLFTATVLSLFSLFKKGKASSIIYILRKANN